MANNNRTEVSAAIQALEAVVGETEFKALIDDVFAKSVVFRKDVSTTDTAATATKTIDFTDIDFITITQSTNVTYTLSGIQQGEIKYLKITKSAGQSIAFSGATQEDENSTYIQALTSIMYEIFNKDGSIQVRAISKTIPSASETYKGIVELATQSEVDAGTTGEKAVTADTHDSYHGATRQKTIDIGDWNMDSTATKQVAHGLTLGKIRGVNVLIRNDDDDVYINLLSSVGDMLGAGLGMVGAGAANISMTRVGSGSFDSPDYSSTSFNRGFIVIDYVN